MVVTQHVFVFAEGDDLQGLISSFNNSRVSSSEPPLDRDGKWSRSAAQRASNTGFAVGGVGLLLMLGGVIALLYIKRVGLALILFKTFILRGCLKQRP